MYDIRATEQLEGLVPRFTAIVGMEERAAELKRDLAKSHRIQLLPKQGDPAPVHSIMRKWFPFRSPLAKSVR